MAASEQPEDRFKTIPFFPDHVTTEAWVSFGVLVLLVVVGVLGQLYPIGLGEPADPMNTPLHAKPEWYFLFLYQMLKYVSKVAGVLIPIAGLIFIAIWPFLDRRKVDTVRWRTVRIIIVVVFLIIATVLTILGEVS